MEILGNTSFEEKNKNIRDTNTDNAENILLSPLESTCLKCMFINPSLSEDILPWMDIFESSLAQKIVNICFELYGLEGDFHLSQIIDKLEPIESQCLEESINKIIVSGNEQDVLYQCIHKWKYNQLETEEKRLIDMLSLADEKENREFLEELTVKLMEIQTEMKLHGGNN